MIAVVLSAMAGDQEGYSLTKVVIVELVQGQLISE